MEKKRDSNHKKENQFSLYPNNLGVLVFTLAAIVIVGGLINPTRAGELAPALFVFGDSLADVGNNNYLQLSLAKADFPHNGIDFPLSNPTGRFSNGKNAADFLAEKLGLPSPPPYLYLQSSLIYNFYKGVSFASGGAGIFNGTDQLYRQSIPFTKQIEHYSTICSVMAMQIGEPALRKIQSKAIHAVVIGSNDILGYYGTVSDFNTNLNSTQFVSLMVNTIEMQLQHLYDIGGRKFMMIGVGAVGCCPSQRTKIDNNECNAASNTMSYEYNRGLRLVLERLRTNLQGFRYTYFDTYSLMLNFIQRPTFYGFKEVKFACCGLGNLNAKVACLPISKFCINRSEYLFWDLYHPTEEADRIVVETAFDGPKSYAYPLNLRELASIE